MGRAATGSVEFRGNPPRWWSRVTMRTEAGQTKRVWMDLERPDLKNTPEDKAIAKRLARRDAKKAIKKTFVGRERAMAPKITVGELEDKWFALIEAAPKLTDSTVESYESCWRANIVTTLGKRPISDLTPPVLRAWVVELGSKKGGSTVRNNAHALTRFLDDAISERWIALTSNPMRDDYVRAALPRQETQNAEDIVHLGRPAIEAALAVSTVPHERFGKWLIDVTTGQREGELHGLQFKHDKTDEAEGIRYLHVLQQAKTARGRLAVRLGVPKRNSKRKVPLHHAAATWLDWWKAEGWTAYVTMADGSRRAPTDDDFIFPAPDGSMWRPDDAEHLRRTLALAGLPESFTTDDGRRIPYDDQALRHSFATMLGELDVSGEVIDTLLGHKPKTTRGKHYQARKLAPLARAVATIELTLPNRPGVAYRAVPHPVESSSQLSHGARRNASESSEVHEKAVESHPSSGVEQRFRKP